MRNILTFEVEDRFHAESPAFELPDRRSRIIPILIHLLDLLDEEKAKATFFVLGWVARKFPEVVALLDSRGHEVASHGFTHVDITTISADKLKEELVKSKSTLEDIIGKNILGFKASSRYLNRENLGIYSIIGEVGFKYDCSLFPRGRRFSPNKLFPIQLEGDNSVICVPQSTYNKFWMQARFGENIRTLPYWFVNRSIKKLNQSGSPAMINMRLWELDKYHPRRMNAEYTDYPNFGNLTLAEEKLKRLLARYEFISCEKYLHLSDNSNHTSLAI